MTLTNENMFLPTSARTFAIGDIHGCASLLHKLLDKIQPTADDTFIFLGDMIDRGPDSKGVLDGIMALQKTAQVICILGNHEQMLLESREHEDVLLPWLRYGGKEALVSFGLPATQQGVQALPSKYVDFLTSCIDYCKTDTHIFCHATPRPLIPMRAASDNDLRWRQLPPNQTPHISNKTIICGHSEQRHGDVHYQAGLVCIDTYAYGHGWLTALEILNETDQYLAWQVNHSSSERVVSITLEQ